MSCAWVVDLDASKDANDRSGAPFPNMTFSCNGDADEIAKLTRGKAGKAVSPGRCGLEVMLTARTSVSSQTCSTAEG